MPPFHSFYLPPPPLLPSPLLSPPSLSLSTLPFHPFTPSLCRPFYLPLTLLLHFTPFLSFPSPSLPSVPPLAACSTLHQRYFSLSTSLPSLYSLLSLYSLSLPLTSSPSSSYVSCAILQTNPFGQLLTSLGLQNMHTHAHTRHSFSPSLPSLPLVPSVEFILRFLSFVFFSLIAWSIFTFVQSLRATFDVISPPSRRLFSVIFSRKKRLKTNRQTTFPIHKVLTHSPPLATLHPPYPRAQTL